MTPQPRRRGSYPKPWLSHSGQVSQLVSRGLVVADKVAVESLLAHVNYYRFSGYCLAFEQSRHQFIPACTFEQIRAAYEFDMALRDLATEALEIVEVDFRAVTAYEFGRRHGAFGHVDPARFHFSTALHQQWIDRLREEADRSSELFIQHYRRTYTEFPDMPIWMAMEVMSFGGLSKMYSGMDRADQRPIAQRYSLQPADLSRILHHFVYVRNLCAHHSRLWDRVWSIKPSLPKGRVWQPPHLPANDRLFATLLLLVYLLKQCAQASPTASGWRDRVFAHLQIPPNAPRAMQLMGMPSQWADHSLWT